MTDRSDELRERLPEADRIRERIREQREAGDDRFAEGAKPDPIAVHEAELKKVVGEDSRLASDSVAVHEAELKKVVGEDSKLASDSVAVHEAELKKVEEGVSSLVDDITVVSESALEQEATAGFDLKEAGDLKVDGLKGVVDHRADDLKVDGLKGVVDHRADDLKVDGLKGVVDHRADDVTGGQGLLVGDHAGHVKGSSAGDSVVDHRADDLMPDDKLTVGDEIDASATPDAISGDADWEVPLTTEAEIGASAEPPADNVEIDVTASLSGGDDPVGDALDPLPGGDDIFASFPDVEVADDAGSPAVDDFDLGDGI